MAALMVPARRPKGRGPGGSTWLFASGLLLALAVLAVAGLWAGVAELLAFKSFSKQKQLEIIKAAPVSEAVPRPVLCRSGRPKEALSEAGAQESVRDPAPGAPQREFYSQSSIYLKSIHSLT